MSLQTHAVWLAAPARKCKSATLIVPRFVWANMRSFQSRYNIYEPWYFVSEGDRTIQVCVEVESPQPVSEDCPVNFRISVTTPNTAGIELKLPQIYSSVG